MPKEIIKVNRRDDASWGDPSPCASGWQPIHVFPRHVSAEGSLTSFGMTLHEETRRLAPRGDKKKRLGVTAGGFTQKHFW